MMAPAGGAEHAQVYGHPRSTREPRRDHYMAPATDEATATAFDAAVERFNNTTGFSPDDPAAMLHLLACLLAEASSRLPGAVAEARRYGLSWAEVADLLGVTRASAWQRFAGHCSASARTGRATT